MTQSISGWKDKALFTPGPLTTSRTVKQAMLRDLGSRDFAFIDMVADIRRRLVALVGGGDDYEAVPMQGSGTFVLESVLSSTVPPDGKVVVLVNGAYGKRIAQMCAVLGIAHVALVYPENTTPDLEELKQVLREERQVTHVVVVHCETTTGIVNPIASIGSVVSGGGVRFVVDGMSSVGAVSVDVRSAHIDYIVSSANKCIEGVPGFGFVVARRDALLETEGFARSLSLDLLAQWKGLESNGQFRFTPPTHSLLAFHQALLELDGEGGVEGRGARYRKNYETLVSGMRALGFVEYLEPEQQGYIITSFCYPGDSNFNFEDFYRRLNDQGFVIYPGKVSDADCFRIGSIGRIFPEDVTALLSAIRTTLEDMNVRLEPAGPAA